MKSLLSFAVICLVAPLAHASSYVSCGAGIPNEELSFESGQELQISSEGDLYDGAVGGTWNLKLRSEPEWMAAIGKVKAVSMENAAGDTVVTITIIQAQTASGPVGLKYVLTGLYDDEPKLEKFALGGFAGGARIGQFSCMSAND